MADLAITHTFNSGDVVSASKFNTNYTTDIAGYINERNAGTTPWDFFYMTRSGGVPLTVNNSTGAFSVAQFKDNGTVVFEISDGGVITASSQSFGRTTPSTGSQTIPQNVATKVTFDTASATQSEFDSTGKFTATSAGLYLVAASVYTDRYNSGISASVIIYKNGSEFSRVTLTGTSVNNNQAANIIDVVSLGAAGYLEIYFLTAKAAGNIVSTSSFFSVHKLS